MKIEDFETLFRTHFKELTFFAFRYVKDVDIAKEIVQEVYVALWEKRDTIDMSKSVKSYLTTSVYNRCLNYLRANKKFNRDILIAEKLFEISLNQGTDEITYSNELATKIDEILNLLPDKCKEIFILNRYENLKYQEIAQKLDISIKTVEAQISKALKIFREHLKDYVILLLILLFLK